MINSKWMYILRLLLSVTVPIAATFFLVSCFSFNGCKLTYTVSEPSPEEMRLKVLLEISDVKNLGETVYLTTQNINIADIEVICENETIAYVVENGTLSFAPTKRSANVNYSIKLGTEGKHGKNGVCFPDLVTFSGDQAFILPEQLVDADNNQISRLVGQIYVYYDMPFQTRIIPFEQDGSTIINKPGWIEVYDFSKNAYVFGDFSEFPLDTGSIFVEGSDSLDGGILRKINVLLNEYKRLYGESPDNTDIVMLRSDREAILGGAGIRTICSTFDSDSPRDWQLLSHRLGHAFFDNSVELRSFHIEPSLWFYEGLITYYETVTMGLIGYDPGALFSEIAGRYYYMRLKDPLLLSVAPMNEKKLILSGQKEFLHYTYAPLILKSLNDELPQQDGVLSFILANRENKNMDVNYVFRNLNDFQNSKLVKDCVYNSVVMNVGFTGTISDAQMLQALRDYEELLWTWFSLDFENYPLDRIDADLISQTVAEAQRRGLLFADEGTMRYIKSFSEIVYDLLMEYALRADVCNVSFDDVELRYELLGDGLNIQIWEEFISELNL